VLDLKDSTWLRPVASLPSKKKWNGWLRFGAVTGVSTAVGLLLANPIAGALAGAAIGATDQVVGAGAQQRLVDPYHPNSWLSFVKLLSGFDTAAYPGMKRGVGVAWQLNPNTIVTRRELSDTLLESLERRRSAFLRYQAAQLTKEPQSPASPIDSD
jgi:hypothetical protein